MYQEQVLSYHHLDEPLDESKLVFEYILAGNLQAIELTSFMSQDTLDCILRLFGLNFFLEILCFLLQNKLFISSNYYWKASFR